MTMKLKIIAKAITIRLNRGETFSEIISSYQALTSLEINELREEFDIPEEV